MNGPKRPRPDARREGKRNWTLRTAAALALALALIAAAALTGETASAQGSPTLSVSGASASEADGTVDFTVTLSEAGENEVTVDYATSDGTATAGSDYTETSGTLTFPAGSTAPQTIAVPVTNDSAYEETETFTLTLSGSSGPVITAGTATGAILDDDTPQVTVSFTEPEYEAPEGGNITIRVYLNADPERTVTIPLTWEFEGGADERDFSGVPAGLEFASGEIQKEFVFHVVDDSEKDDGESVRLGFRTENLPEGITPGANPQAAVSIIDDDPAVRVSFGAPAYSAAEGGTVEVAVTLDIDPERNLEIPITQTGRQGIGPEDHSGIPESVSFTLGETRQTFTFTAVDDFIDDDGENVALRLGPGLPPGVSAGAVSRAEIRIEDDDARGLIITPAALTVDEGASGSYQVVLTSQPTETVTVAIKAGSPDIETRPDRLVFPPEQWDTPQEVTAAALHDQDDVGETESIVHQPSGGDYGASENVATEISVNDDEDPGHTPSGAAGQPAQLLEDGRPRVPTPYGGRPALVLEYDEITLREGGQTPYVIRLGSQPRGSVTVNISASSTGRGQAVNSCAGAAAAGASVATDPAQIVFTADGTEWEQGISVNITAGTDGDELPDTPHELVHTSTSADPEYDGLTQTAAVRVQDREERRMAIAPGGVTLPEGRRNTVGVSLNSPPSGEVTLEPMGHGGRG